MVIRSSVADLEDAKLATAGKLYAWQIRCATKMNKPQTSEKQRN